MPWSMVEPLAPEPSGLFEVVWAEEVARGRAEFVPYDGPWMACDTPADYLSANLLATGGRSVVGEDAVVEGDIERCVVWPGCRVEAGERLVDSIRADGGMTVDGRRGSA